MVTGGASRVRSVRFAVVVVALSVLGVGSVGVSSASAAGSDTIASLVNEARTAATSLPPAAASARQGPSPSPKTEKLANTAAKTAQDFPVGYIVGIVLVVLGLAGGIYGQVLRRRGRRSSDN